MKFSKIFVGIIAMMICLATSFSSCKKEINPQNSEYSQQHTENGVDTTNFLRTGQVSTPNPNDFDEVYTVNLSTYTHIWQQSYGYCSVAAYVSARSIKHPDYPATFYNAQLIKAELDNQYGAGSWGIYQLKNRNDGTAKDLFSKPAGNNLWSNNRTLLKNWLKNKISQGKPCIMPCLYNMSTDTSDAGHFYVIVSLYLKNGGTGSVVGVKDVWVTSSSTQYFSYTDMLDANWYNSRKNSGVGCESYCAMSFD